MTNEESINNSQQMGPAVSVPPPLPVVHIPPHIAGNLLEFLRRVKSDGMEAVAWVEAYQFVQRHAPPSSPQPGVPFAGLPPK
jgi:hypothetical protein